MKNLFFIFLLVNVSFKLSCQNNRENIKGKIINDSLSVENIHIINKTSGRVTISNTYGEFQISVKENDTLFISSIQFENKDIIITPAIIKNKVLSIVLFPKTIKLKEVIIKNHHLSGNLKTDVTTTKIENVVDQFILDLPNAGRIPIPAIDSLDVQWGLTISVNFDALYRRINGDFKSLKKLQNLKKEDQILKKIRQSVTDNYFIESLKIPKDYISNFLYYTVSKGIVSLYEQNKRIEVINLLFKESKNYRKFKNID